MSIELVLSQNKPKLIKDGEKVLLYFPEVSTPLAKKEQLQLAESIAEYLSKK